MNASAMLKTSRGVTPHVGGVKLNHDTFGLPERFWSKVDRRGPDECWPWTRCKNQRGYGLFSIKNRHFSASRVLMMAIYGPQPKHIFACHSCDNPSCCNPAHIWTGTNSDNIRDSFQKGRSVRPFKTHCPRGHEYVHKNKKGESICRICVRASNNRGYRRRMDAIRVARASNVIVNQDPGDQQ